jgi:hypothetical protein
MAPSFSNRNLLKKEPILQSKLRDLFQVQASQTAQPIPKPQNQSSPHHKSSTLHHTLPHFEEHVLKNAGCACCTSTRDSAFVLNLHADYTKTKSC